MASKHKPILLTHSGKKHSAANDDEKLDIDYLAGNLDADHIDLDSLVSGDSGNQIEARDNGLYYGQEASADTSSLYVDSENGDDSSEKGNKNHPLATIKEAFDRNSTGQGFTIHLKEGQTHEWKSSWRGTANGKRATFDVYGSVRDEAHDHNPRGTTNYSRSEQLDRPTIKFVVDQRAASGASGYKDKPVVFNEFDQAKGKLTFNRVKLDCRAYEDYGVRGLYKGFFGRRDYGVDIKMLGVHVLMGPYFYLAHVDSDSTIVCDAVWLDDSDGDKFVYFEGGTGASLSLNLRGGGYDGGEEIGRSDEFLTRMKTTDYDQYHHYIDDSDGPVSGNINSTKDLGFD